MEGSTLWHIDSVYPKYDDTGRLRFYEAIHSLLRQSEKESQRRYWLRRIVQGQLCTGDYDEGHGESCKKCYFCHNGHTSGIAHPINTSPGSQIFIVHGNDVLTVLTGLLCSGCQHFW